MILFYLRSTKRWTQNAKSITSFNIKEKWKTSKTAWPPWFFSPNRWSYPCILVRKCTFSEFPASAFKVRVRGCGRVGPCDLCGCNGSDCFALSERCSCPTLDVGGQERIADAWGRRIAFRSLRSFLATVKKTPAARIAYRNHRFLFLSKPRSGIFADL